MMHITGGLRHAAYALLFVGGEIALCSSIQSIVGRIFTQAQKKAWLTPLSDRSVKLMAAVTATVICAFASSRFSSLCAVTGLSMRLTRLISFLAIVSFATNSLRATGRPAAPAAAAPAAAAPTPFELPRERPAFLTILSHHGEETEDNGYYLPATSINQLIGGLLTESSIVVVGAPGTGKSLAVDRLVNLVNIRDARVADLKDCVFAKLSTSAFTGNTYTGGTSQHASQLETFAQAVKRQGKTLVIVVDEVQTLIQQFAVGNIKQRAMDLLLDNLGRNLFKILGTTNPEHWNPKQVSPAIQRRFITIPMLPPNREEVRDMLMAANRGGQYTRNMQRLGYDVVVEEAAIDAVIDWTRRSPGNYPAKATVLLTQTITHECTPPRRDERITITADHVRAVMQQEAQQLAEAEKRTRQLEGDAEAETKYFQYMQDPADAAYPCPQQFQDELVRNLDTTMGCVVVSNDTPNRKIRSWIGVQQEGRYHFHRLSLANLLVQKVGPEFVVEIKELCKQARNKRVVLFIESPSKSLTEGDLKFLCPLLRSLQAEKDNLRILVSMDPSDKHKDVWTEWLVEMHTPLEQPNETLASVQIECGQKYSPQVITPEFMCFAVLCGWNGEEFSSKQARDFIGRFSADETRSPGLWSLEQGFAFWEAQVLPTQGLLPIRRLDVHKDFFNSHGIDIDTWMRHVRKRNQIIPFKPTIPMPSFLEWMTFDTPEAGRLVPEAALNSVLTGLLANQNIVLLAKPGVGKTALVRCLAERIRQRDPALERLNNIILIRVNLADLIGAQYAGDLPRKVANWIAWARHLCDLGKQPFFVIDEAHLLTGAGRYRDQPSDLWEFLKAAMEGEDAPIRLIAMTNEELWTSGASKVDPAIRRRFVEVKLLPPSPRETIRMLQQSNLLGVYTSPYKDKGFNVTITDDAIEEVVEVTSKDTSSEFPAKAVRHLETVTATACASCSKGDVIVIDKSAVRRGRGPDDDIR